MGKITHLDLVILSELLGVPHTGGLCRGFSLTLAQAIFADDTETFWRRLKFLADNKNNFPSLLQQINQARIDTKGSKEWGDNTMDLLEIPAFFDTISLYHSPEDYDIFSGGRVSSQDFDKIYPLAKSKQLDNSNFVIAQNKAFAFDRDSLTRYFRDLEEVMKKYPNVPIVTDSSSHSVLLKYQPENPEKPWMYVDTNDFKRYPDNPEYYRELTTEELVESLFVSLGSDPSPYHVTSAQGSSNHLLINMSIMVNETHPLNGHQSLNDLDAKYKIDSTHIEQHDYDNTGILYIACSKGNYDLVKELIQIPGINIHKTTNGGWSPLHIACQQNYLDIVEELVQIPDININQEGPLGATPLFVACQNGNWDIATALLKKGANINQPQAEGATPFFFVCQQGKLAMVKKLLQTSGIDIKQARNDGITPLHIACQNGHIEIVEELLQIPNYLDSIMNNGTSLLKSACCSSNPQIIRRLLKEGIDVNEAFEKGITALLISSDTGDIEMVNLLLEHGAEINQEMKDGTTPLMIACTNNHIDLVKRLLQIPNIDVYKSRNDGITPFLMACENGHLEIFKELIQLPDMKNEIKKETIRGFPLSICCCSPKTQDKPELFHLLLENGADLFYKEEEGEMAFDVAFVNKNDAAMQALLLYAIKKGSSPEAIMSPDTFSQQEEWSHNLPTMTTSIYKKRYNEQIQENGQQLSTSKGVSKI